MSTLLLTMREQSIDEEMCNQLSPKFNRSKIGSINTSIPP